MAIAATGGSAGSDVRRGQPTPMLGVGKDDRRPASAEVRRALSAGGQPDPARVADLIRRTGAADEVERMISVRGR
jgi:hypothetical protein